MSVDLEYPLAGSSVGQPTFSAGGDYSPGVLVPPPRKKKGLTSTARIKCTLTGLPGGPLDSTTFDIPDADNNAIWFVSFTVPLGTYAPNCRINVHISIDLGAYSASQDEALSITVGSALAAPLPGGTVVALPPP